jgi:hypothetical protein
MNVWLSFNMFKWGGSMNIKWGSPFGYPKHVLTLMSKIQMGGKECNRKFYLSMKHWKRVPTTTWTSPNLENTLTCQTFSKRKRRKKRNQKVHLKPRHHLKGNSNRKEGKTQEGGLKGTKLNTYGAKQLAP